LRVGEQIGVDFHIYTPQRSIEVVVWSEATIRQGVEVLDDIWGNRKFLELLAVKWLGIGSGTI
jgi:hypothetical protein